MCFFVRIALALLIGGFGVAANAAPVGKTIAVATRVTGSGPGGNRVLQAKSPIFSDDRLRANASGNAQIILVDKTRIIVGPGADLRIDDFVFSSKKTFSKLVIRASKGAFRFISGRSKSSAYVIVTPSATIGVRGTALDVTIRREGSHIALLRGAIRACDRRGRCRTIKNPCDYLLVGKRGFSKARKLRVAGNQELDKVFPLLINQRKLKRSFRKSLRGCRSTAIRDASRKVAPKAKSVPNVKAVATVMASVNPPSPPSQPARHGNPGNGRSVGKAGPSPGPGNYGGPTNGKGDVNGNGHGVGNSPNGGSTGSGNGNGKGNGKGHGNGNGNGKR